MKIQSGFTLIELSIVLVIIGLLLGGVLKGQELMTSARIRNVVSDFSGTAAGVYGYQDRYKAIPGDDNGADARWSTTSTNGNGNGVLASAFDAGSGESYTFWQHLRQAGFIGGSGGGGPANAYSGKLGVQDGADSFQNAGGAGSGLKGLVICESHIPDKAALAIDNQIDDGKSNSGTLRAVKESTSTSLTTADASYVEDGTSYYTLCKSL